MTFVVESDISESIKRLVVAGRFYIRDSDARSARATTCAGRAFSFVLCLPKTVHGVGNNSQSQKMFPCENGSRNLSSVPVSVIGRRRKGTPPKKLRKNRRDLPHNVGENATPNALRKFKPTGRKTIQNGLKS